MVGSICIITVLLLMVVFLQTASWGVLAAVTWKITQVGNNSQVGFRGRWFLDHQITPASLVMKEVVYKLRNKREICAEL